MCEKLVQVVQKEWDLLQINLKMQLVEKAKKIWFFDMLQANMCLNNDIRYLRLVKP